MSGNELPQNDYQTLLAEISARYMAANIPIRAQVEVTKRCHLNCRHCYVDHLETKQELKTSEILSIFDQLEELGTLFLTLTGGEFFLRKDAWTILEQARDRQFFIKLYTTGNFAQPGRYPAAGPIGYRRSSRFRLFPPSGNPRRHHDETRQSRQIAGSHSNDASRRTGGRDEDADSHVEQRRYPGNGAAGKIHGLRLYAEARKSSRRKTRFGILRNTCFPNLKWTR